MLDAFKKVNETIKKAREKAINENTTILEALKELTKK